MASGDPFRERAEETRLLGSWKEISRYLNCSLRTCQRWEKELDLPVHRLDGTPKARVFAYEDELDRWLKEKLNHSDELRGKRVLTWPRLKKWLIPSAAGFVILAAGAYLMARFFSLPLPPLPEHKPSLAILPFENTSGDDNMESWRTALPDLIITDMAQSRFVNVVRITELYRGLVELKLGEASRFSDDDLKRIAEKIGVDHIATGSIGKDGSDLVLTVLVKSPGTEEDARSVRADLRGERGVFVAADDLTKGIRRSLGLDKKYVSRDIDKDVSGVSTHSPQAFKFFSQGYRLIGINKYPEGIALLQKAAEADPEFALAYKYLWRACMNTRREEDEKNYIHRAVELSGRLSERERGDLRVLFYKDYEQDPVKEKEALERLWRYHPDDRFGGPRLMSSYIQKEDWSRALPVAEKARQANKTELIFVLGSARCYANMGLGEKAVQLLTEFFQANPDHPNLWMTLLFRAKCYLIQEKFDAALADIETLSAYYPNAPADACVHLRGIVDMLRNDFPGAERGLRGLLERAGPSDKLEALLLLRDLCLIQGKVGEAKKYLHQGIDAVDPVADDARQIPAKKSSLHFELAYLHRITGDLSEALKEVEEALQIERKHTLTSAGFEAHHLRALILLEMDKMEEFHKQAEEIRQSVEQENTPKAMKVYYHLLGHGELRKNNAKKAVDYFWKAIDLLSIPGPELDGADPEYFYSLAEAYGGGVAGTDWPRALSMYEKVILPTVNRLHSGDLYARSLYRIAKIYDVYALDRGMTIQEIQSNKSKAIENYRKFLELWKDADPIFEAEIRDAKQRLTALESE